MRFSAHRDGSPSDAAAEFVNLPNKGHSGVYDFLQRSFENDQYCSRFNCNNCFFVKLEQAADRHARSAYHFPDLFMRERQFQI